MAVLVQDVVGQRSEDRFYPCVSGVARSRNYYPTGHDRPEDGVVHLALGLGKTIVEAGLRHLPGLFLVRVERPTGIISPVGPEVRLLSGDLLGADQDVEEAVAVVQAWKRRYIAVGAHPGVDYVLIFENKGSLVGTSNPHPHCQLYGGNLVYGIAERERAATT